MPSYTRREALGILGGAATALAQGNQQPNILYIMADDHAAHAISRIRQPINRTPNIDRIATGRRAAHQLLLHELDLHAQPRRDPHRPVQPQERRLHADDALDPARNNVAKELQTRRLSDRHDRQVAPGDGSRPASTTGTSCPARASTTIPTFIEMRRAQAVHRLLHRPDRRFHARLAEAARHEASRSS